MSESMKWEGKVGPAFVAVLIQTLVLFGGIIMVYARLSDGVEATKNQVTELKSVTSTLRDGQLSATERVVKVETSLNFIASALDRLDKKLDTKMQ